MSQKCDKQTKRVRMCRSALCQRRSRLSAAGGFELLERIPVTRAMTACPRESISPLRGDISVRRQHVGSVPRRGSRVRASFPQPDFATTTARR